MTLIGTKEVAKLLGKHRNTVRQWIQSGQLPAPTIRERYWVKSDVEKWIKDHATTQEAQQ